MTDSQLLARAFITATVIQKEIVGDLRDADAFDGEKGDELRRVVDAVFRAAINEKPKTKQKR